MDKVPSHGEKRERISRVFGSPCLTTGRGSGPKLIEPEYIALRNRTGDSGFTKYLTGDWRLVYTTGTRKTEDEIGRINYVPITAVQRFDMEKKFIRNGASWSRIMLYG